MIQVNRFIKAALLTSLLSTSAFGDQPLQEGQSDAVQANVFDWGWLGSVKLELIANGPFGKSLGDIESRLSEDGFNFQGVQELFPVDPGFDPTYDASNPERTFKTTYTKTANSDRPVTESHVVMLLTTFKRIDGRLTITSLLLKDLGNRPI